MKKIFVLIIFAFALSCFFVSCEQKKADSGQQGDSIKSDIKTDNADVSSADKSTSPSAEKKGVSASNAAEEKSAASNAPSAGVKEVSFLTMQLQPTFNEYVEKVIAEFEKEHPDVKIKWIDYPAQNYDTKLMSGFLAGNAPDVVNINPDSGPNYLQRDNLLDLAKFVTPEEKAIYFEQVVERGCTYKGTFYSLPWYLAISLTMYNTEIFKKAGLDINKPPQTWDEVRECSVQIKEKTGLFGTLPIYTEIGSLKGFLYGDGVQLVDDSGKKAIFNNEQGYQTIKFFANLYKDNLIPKEVLTAQHRRPIELYKTGKIAIFITGPQFLKMIKNDAPDMYKATKCARSIAGKTGKIPVIAMTLGVAKQSKHPKEAVEFAKFVTNAKNQLDFCKIVTIMPSVKSAAEDPYFTTVGENPSPEDEARMIAAKALKDAVVEVYPRERQGELNTIMEDAIQKACLGTMTPEAALDEAAEGWTKVLNK